MEQFAILEAQNGNGTDEDEDEDDTVFKDQKVVSQSLSIRPQRMNSSRYQTTKSISLSKD